MDISIKTCFALVFAGILMLFSTPGLAGDNGACKRYAQEAVRQNQQNITLNAKFTGPAWTSNYDAHYNWCIHGQNVKSTPVHMASRENQLQDFMVKNKPKKIAGERYASEAVRQFNASQEMNTGFKPPAWSKDYKNHFNWIMHGQNISAAARHLADRESKLQQFAVKHGYKGRGMVYGVVTQTYKAPEAKVAKMDGPKTVHARLPSLNRAPFLARADALINARLVNSANAPLTPAENPIFDIPVGEDVGQPVHIGRGYNSLVKKPTFPAVDIPRTSIQTLHVNKVYSESNYVRSMEDYYKHLGVDVKASGSYLGFSGSSHNQFEKSEKNHKFNERFVAFVNAQTALEFTTLSDLKLNPKALNVLKTRGVNEFFRQYGDCFVYAIQYGAGLRGVGTYQLLKKEEAYKFSTQNKASGNWLVGGFDMSVGVTKQARTQKENEARTIAFAPFGSYAKHPGSIKELQDIVRNFAKDAGLLAQQSSHNNKFGGIIYYTVMKFSELPEFQQIAGVNSLNLREPRKLLDQLSYYQRKIGYMLNNLNYVAHHPDEFKAHEVQKAKGQIMDLTRYLTAVEHDIAVIQQYPLDRAKWQFNPNNLRYDQIPSYAPDTRYVRVKVNFPAQYKDDFASASSGHDYSKHHVGPLIKYNHVKGDNQTGGGKIDINVHTRLEIRSNGREAYLHLDFLEKENRSDQTTFQGLRDLKVYQAPEGYTIVGFKKSAEDYFLRDLNINAPYTQGTAAVLNVHASLRDKHHFLNYPIKDPIWPNLSVIFDTPGGDYEVGVFGDLVFEAALKENNPGY